MTPQRRKRGRQSSSSLQECEDDATPVPTQYRDKAAYHRGLEKKEDKPAENGETVDKEKRRKVGASSDCQAMEGKGVESRIGSVHQINHHIAHYLRNMSQGSRPCPRQNLALNARVVSVVKELHPYLQWGFFDRRATALAWHPRSHATVTVGTKSGCVFLWNFEQDPLPTHSILGSGANGSIQALILNKNNSDQMFTASINGTVTRYTDFRNQKILLSTHDCNHWYTSLDLSVDCQALLAGDNKGWITFLTPSDQIAWRHRLHSLKVTHIEFSPRDSRYLVTASVDRMLKVWDIRNIKSSKSYLYCDFHEKPINSAYFSRTDGNRLLTTDQGRELRVYTLPYLNLTHKLLHPHRHFQHLTPIKATWHPLRDLIVVGRYPDPNLPGTEADELRTIDFFDGDNGQLMHQHFTQSTENKIISLNLFSPSGDYLLSAGGTVVWLWKQKHSEEKLLLKIKQKVDIRNSCVVVEAETL